jgi:hypothetical protein
MNSKRIKNDIICLISFPNSFSARCNTSLFFSVGLSLLSSLALIPVTKSVNIPFSFVELSADSWNSPISENEVPLSWKSRFKSNLMENIQGDCYNEPSCFPFLAVNKNGNSSIGLFHFFYRRVKEDVFLKRLCHSYS